MKIHSLILIALLTLSTRTYAQWGSFDIYINPTQWFDETKDYAKQANFKQYNVLTQGGITGGEHGTTSFSPTTIARFLEKNYPDPESEGILMLDWESNVFHYLKEYPESDPKFKYAENQWVAVINIVRKLRPNLKITIYGMPFRAYNAWQKVNNNKPGALDNIISRIDIITPSLYIGYPDEERGRDFNLNYLKDMMDFAMVYGKRHNKPVMPVFWHRVLRGNKLFPRGILQKDTFSDYIEFIKDYSNDGFKVSGLLLWDDNVPAARLTNLEGVAYWVKGSIKNYASYDAFSVSMMKNIVNKLNK